MKITFNVKVERKCEQEEVGMYKEYIEKFGERYFIEEMKDALEYDIKEIFLTTSKDLINININIDREGEN